jgi:hypothetical protein
MTRAGDVRAIAPLGRGVGLLAVVRRVTASSTRKPPPTGIGVDMITPELSVQRPVRSGSVEPIRIAALPLLAACPADDCRAGEVTRGGPDRPARHRPGRRAGSPRRRRRSGAPPTKSRIRFDTFQQERNEPRDFELLHRGIPRPRIPKGGPDRPTFSASTWRKSRSSAIKGAIAT